MSSNFPPGVTQRDIDEHLAESSLRYKVEVHCLSKNRWELFAEARTFDEAFDKAATAVGFSKDHDTIAILDRDDTVLWDSEGFRQGAGKLYPDWSREKR